jgi:uncharacterized protein
MGAVSGIYADKYQQLLKHLQQLALAQGGLTVAYSGGVDSAFLLAAAADALSMLSEAPPLCALTAISPSYPEWEREPARSLAQTLGAKHIEVETDELDRAEYRANAGDRCYHCKAALFDVATLHRKVSHNTADQVYGALVYGAITDDLGDHRPGMQAAQDHGVTAPLIDVGLSKSEVRALSHELGLPTWDKPASACLASRFPYGTEVTAERLDQVGRCEARLMAFGLKVVRARYHGDLVRLELGEQELERVLSDRRLRQRITSACKDIGFRFVSLDLDGYRSGSANEALVVIQ